MFESLKQVAQSTQTSISINASDLHLNNAPTQVQGGEIQALLNTVYFIAGIVAVIVIIFGGIRYATSAGDSSNVQSAKNTVQYAVIGLVVVIAAAAITDFVIRNAAG